MKRITRRQFCGLTASALGSLTFVGGCGVGAGQREQPLGSKSTSRPARPPNLLFVMPDEWRAFELGCSGNDQIKTPQLDALAAQGARFSQAFCVSPLCTPNRATLLTGRFPRSHQTRVNSDVFPQEEVTIAEVLRGQGYRTGYVGKWHLAGETEEPGDVRPEQRQGFDYFRGSNHGHYYQNPQYYADGELIQRPGEYEPDVYTELAAEFIRANQHNPFFLFVSYGPPHEPLDQIEESLVQEYETTQFKYRDNVIPDGVTETRFRQYYGACTGLDRNIKQLLQLLVELQLEQDTLVVFTSDHGSQLASQGLWGKSMPFEESVRIPLILRMPGVITPGAVNEDLFTHVDLMPTLLGLLQAPIPGAVEGIDRSEALRNGVTDAPAEVFLCHYQKANWRAIRTGRWLYAERTAGENVEPRVPGCWRNETPWKLYDLKTDSFQLNNLVDSQQHAELREELRLRLTAWADCTKKRTGKLG
jgi:arylsulfatase A-like enzyme